MKTKIAFLICLFSSIPMSTFAADLSAVQSTVFTYFGGLDTDSAVNPTISCGADDFETTKENEVKKRELQKQLRETGFTNYEVSKKSLLILVDVYQQFKQFATHDEQIALETKMLTIDQAQTSFGTK